MKKIKLGKYRHYKGNFYEVIGIARHSETLEQMVVYRDLYKTDEFGDNALWVRPLKMFMGKAEVNGKKVSRFKYIGSSSCS
ncbi:MAG TPA: DUF1653 domain-containing protein [Candidatus Bathyarchaeia archaeon]|nr:DUF1653 domain-containing protein [Candidatus Bathyarchaeia archaeon]